MAIKKAYEAIVKFMQDNDQKKVSTILPAIIDMCTAKRASSANTYIKDVDGQVVAIFDTFYKKWMALVGDEAVDFGSKAGSPTGFSNTCKEGNNEWTKLNRKRKNALASILDELKSGDLEPAGITDREVQIQKEFDAAIEAATTEKGFDTKEDVLEYLEDEGIEVLVTAPESD